MRWTIEQLLSLDKARLEILRQNAQRRSESELVQRITDIQQGRKKAVPADESPVIGFHFICDNDYEVTVLPDGTIKSGVWVVSEDHCEPARALKGYVALHRSKTLLSYRQGTVLDWNIEQRTKGKTPLGVTFRLRPFATSLPWFGNATGEKGYRRLDDMPPWEPFHS